MSWIACIVMVKGFVNVGNVKFTNLSTKRALQDLIKLLQLDSMYGYLKRFWSCTNFQKIAKMSISLFVEYTTAPYRNNNSIQKEKPF